MISRTYDQGAKRFISPPRIRPLVFAGFSVSSRRRASPDDAVDFAPFRRPRTALNHSTAPRADHSEMAPRGAGSAQNGLGDVNAARRGSISRIRYEANFASPILLEPARPEPAGRLHDSVSSDVNGLRRHSRVAVTGRDKRGEDGQGLRGPPSAHKRAVLPEPQNSAASSTRRRFAPSRAAFT